MKPTKLKDLHLFEVSKVDDPANQHAEFLLLKRNTEANMANDPVEEMKAAAQAIVDLKKNNEALAAEVAALKKAAINPEAAQAEIEKALPAAVRDQLETLRKANEAAMIQLAAMADEREIAKAISETALEFGHLPVKADELGPVLKRAMGALKADDMVVLRRVLKAANTAIHDATRSVGYTAARAANSAEAAMEAAAAAIAKAENVSLAKANVLAMERNPALYAQYLTERGAAN